MPLLGAIRNTDNTAARSRALRGTQASLEQGRPAAEWGPRRTGQPGATTSPSHESERAVNAALAGGGRPLPATTRAFMESRLASDFSTVRVHDGAAAQRATRALEARAFTLGQDLVFGAGQFAPHTRSGQRLIAHELAHVIQQSKPARLTGGVRQPQRAPLSDDEAARTPPDEATPEAASQTGSLTIDAFDTDKFELTASHAEKLERQAATLQRLLEHYPDSFIQIVGFTDAVGTEAYNAALGQRRADAVLAALGARGVPSKLMSASSLGEGSLKIETKEADARNRRVEIWFKARRFFGAAPPERTPQPQPDTATASSPPAQPPNLRLPPDYVERRRIPERDPGPDFLKPIPPAPKRSDPLDDALDRDPLLRALPKILRNPLKGALKTLDEKVADQAVDTLPADGLDKAAVKAALKALLKTLKGEKWVPPVAPVYEPPASRDPGSTKAPGETIIPGPVWKF